MKTELNFMKQADIKQVIYLLMQSPKVPKIDRVTKKEAYQSIESIEPDDNAIVVDFSIRCFVGKLYLSQHSGKIRLYNEDDKEEKISRLQMKTVKEFLRSKNYKV